MVEGSRRSKKHEIRPPASRRSKQHEIHPPASRRSKQRWLQVRCLMQRLRSICNKAEGHGCGFDAAEGRGQAATAAEQMGGEPCSGCLLFP